MENVEWGRAPPASTRLPTGLFSIFHSSFYIRERSDRMETRLSPRAKLIAFWVLAGLGLALVAHFFSLLSPFLWAIVTAYIFSPVISWVARHTHLPRPLIATTVYIAIVAGLIIGIVTLVPIIRQQA